MAWGARVCVWVALVLITGGCPPTLDLGSDSSGVEARIAISVTRGAAPLKVAVSGAESGSRNGEIVAYAWDFGGERVSNLAADSHTFSRPGRYFVTLTVTDATGAQGSAREEVRVAGGPVTAVIRTSATRGAAPFTIEFDGTASTAEDDRILDYYWDFGDGGTSRRAVDAHTFERGGKYTVTLRAVSAGGVEGTASVQITIEGGAGSLQFSGGQFATLPVATSEALREFTFEAWYHAESDGGTLVLLGTPEVSVTLLPGSSLLRLRTGENGSDSIVFNLAGGWRHLALVYTTSGATVYLDGTAVAGAGTRDPVRVSQILLGGAFRGKVTAARFWSTARSESEIAANRRLSLPATTPDLLGNWPLNEGRGQTLANHVTGGVSGTLGSSAALEASDPAWSSDGP